MPQGCRDRLGLPPSLSPQQLRFVIRQPGLRSLPATCSYFCAQGLAQGSFYIWHRIQHCYWSTPCSGCCSRPCLTASTMILAPIPTVTMPATI
jgi:hypothetical protein